MAFFPLFINIKNRDVLVAGSSDSLAYQIASLVSFGAKITLYSETLTPEIEKLVKQNSSEGTSLSFIKENLTESILPSLEIKPVFVIASSPDPKLNAAVYEFFHAQNVPVEDVTDLGRCDFLFPALIKQNDVVCGISSSGKSAHVAHFVRGLVESSIPPTIGEINDRMEELREMVRLSLPDVNRRNEALKLIFSRLVEDDNQTSDSDIDALMAQFGM